MIFRRDSMKFRRYGMKYRRYGMNKRYYFPLAAVLLCAVLSGCGWEAANAPADLIPERIKTEAEEKAPDFQSPDAETERLTERIIGTAEISDTELPEKTKLPVVTEASTETKLPVVTEASMETELPEVPETESSIETETAAASVSQPEPVLPPPETTMTLDFVGDVLLLPRIMRSSNAV